MLDAEAEHAQKEMKGKDVQARSHWLCSAPLLLPPLPLLLLLIFAFLLPPSSAISHHPHSALGLAVPSHSNDSSFYGPFARGFGLGLRYVFVWLVRPFSPCLSLPLPFFVFWNMAFGVFFIPLF